MSINLDFSALRHKLLNPETRAVKPFILKNSSRCSKGKKVLTKTRLFASRPIIWYTTPRCDFLPLRPRCNALVQDSLYIHRRPIPYATSPINFIKRMLYRHQFKESTEPSQLFSLYSASQQTNSGNTFSRVISDYALRAIALSAIIYLLLWLLGASPG